MDSTLTPDVFELAVAEAARAAAVAVDAARASNAVPYDRRSYQSGLGSVELVDAARASARDAAAFAARRYWAGAHGAALGAGRRAIAVLASSHALHFDYGARNTALAAETAAQAAYLASCYEYAVWHGGGFRGGCLPDGASITRDLGAARAAARALDTSASRWGPRVERRLITDPDDTSAPSERDGWTPVVDPASAW